MAERIEAIVKPELLIWARNSIGLNPDDAAQKIGVKLEKLLLWESGDTRPTINQLRKAANVYKRPLAVFFLPEPPKKFDTMKDFRKVPEVERNTFSPSLNLQIRRALYKRDVVLELYEELDEEILEFKRSASIDDDPEKLAHDIRHFLNVSFEEQTKWSRRYDAFNAWKAKIENHGILVFQTTHTSSVEIDEMRGFSISEKFFPTIVINSKDSTSGKIFTLLHEFCHLLLHNGGICDLEEYKSPSNEFQKVEVFCNHVSGAVLVPANYFLNHEILIKHGDNSEWAEYEIYNLANHYSVSREVILRRLLILGRTTRNFYTKKREEYIEEYRQRDLNDTTGYPPYHRLVIRSLGQSYIRLVLSAYYQEVITSSQVSDYLGIKFNHVAKIESEVLQ